MNLTIFVWKQSLWTQNFIQEPVKAYDSKKIPLLKIYCKIRFEIYTHFLDELQVIPSRFIN